MVPGTYQGPMRNSPLTIVAFLLLFGCGGLVPSVRADRAGQDMVRESDAALNRAYQQTLANLKTSEAKARSREAQRAWIAFRDAEAALMNELTSTPLDTEEHVAAMNEVRTKQLKALPAPEAGTADEAAASDDDSTPMDRDYRVRCKVGLVVHAAPDAKSRKVGTLEDGQNIQLDGKRGPRRGTVFPVISTDKGETAGATWIKISAPLQGYVLFQSDENPDNDYIVPQILPE